jgi:hypothetical protein
MHHRTGTERGAACVGGAIIHIRYAQLALLLNDALSDSSVVSVFGFNASAHFCQHLGKSNPFIFDWLLDRSTGEQRAAFRGIMRGMTETYAEFGHQGVYAQLVDETDIGPLLLWLTLASDHQVIFSAPAILQCAGLGGIRRCHAANTKIRI